MGNESIVPTDAQVVQPIESQPVEINTPLVDTPIEPPVEAAPTPVEPTKTEIITPEPAEQATTVLGEAIKNEAKPEEKPEEAVKTESVQSEEPAPMPTYEDFTLPENFTKGEGIGDVAKLLGEFELSTKADHAEVQKLGQALIDRHVAEVQKTVEAIQSNLAKQRETQVNEWKEAFLADPEIGGNRQNTTINSALEFIRTHGGTPEQQNEFHQILEQSGLGSHPAMIRLLATAAKSKEFKEGSPVPAKAPSPVLNKFDKRYGKM